MEKQHSEIYAQCPRCRSLKIETVRFTKKYPGYTWQHCVVDFPLKDKVLCPTCVGGHQTTMTTRLSDKIRDFIAKQDKPISYDQIIARGQSLGNNVHDLHAALREVHRFKDIDVKQRMGTIYYSVVQLHQ